MKIAQISTQESTPFFAVKKGVYTCFAQEDFLILSEESRKCNLGLEILLPKGIYLVVDPHNHLSEKGVIYLFIFSSNNKKI